MYGQLSFTVDDSAGLVRVAGSGMWLPERAETHFGNLDRALVRVRVAHGRARVLVDLRQAAVQMAKTAEVIRGWTERIYESEDRVAVVCAKTLLALQIKHAAQVHQLATFHEVAPALLWLGEAQPAPLSVCAATI